ncbi:MAG: winged helix-turn-helix transcriptional regulator [Thermoplasmata archaeon]|nr:MAG: winged helix-turn-helix transcriptional regulator [Thermoplasmata archaeon]
MSKRQIIKTKVKDMQKLTKIMITILVINLLFLSSINLFSGQAEVSEESNINISFSEGEELQIANVKPGANHTVTFPGKVTGQVFAGSDFTDFYVYLSGSSVNDWEVLVKPTVIHLKPGDEAQFSASVSVPENTSYFITDTLTIDGYAIAQPGDENLSIDAITGSIQIAQFFSLEVNCEDASKKVEKDDKASYVIEIVNKGNGRDTAAIEIENSAELLNAGLTVQLNYNSIEIDEKQKNSFNVMVITPTIIKDGKYDIDVIVYSETQEMLEGTADKHYQILSVLVGNVEDDTNGNGANGGDSNGGGSNATDSDGDGYSDEEEEESGSDPNDIKSTPEDLDGDGIPNDKDDYPLDPDRWEKEGSNSILIIAIIIIIVIFFALAYFSYSRITHKNVLDHDTRLTIFEYIRTHPGEHLGGLSVQLAINEGTLRHHLRNLENTGQIKVKRDGKYKYFYPLDYNDSLMLTPVQKEIVEIVRQNGGVTTQDVADRLGKERQTIVYHMSNLTEKGILRSQKMENKVFWHVDAEALGRTNFNGRS